MELKQYFKKIKDAEASISEAYPLIVSSETEDGGKPGVVVEVSRREAARAIVENRAALASEEQKQAHWEQVSARKKMAEKIELSRRLQIAIVSDSGLRDAAIRDENAEGPKGSK